MLEHCIRGNTHWELDREEHDSVSSGFFVERVYVDWCATFGEAGEMEP